MAIVTGSAPQNATSALAADLQQMIHNRVLLPIWGGIDATRIHASQPIAVFVVSASDVGDGALVAAAKPGGWRAILFDGHQPIASADMVEEGGTVRLTKVTSGRYTDRIVQGMAAAESLLAAGPDYEVRLLSAPAMGFHALWCHGSDDRFMPLAEHNDLTLYALYTEMEISDALRSSAQASLSSKKP